MFLHSGASLHGHEYSPTNNHRAQENSLGRTSFQAPLTRLATYENTQPTIGQPARPSSERPQWRREHVSGGEPEGNAMSEDGISSTSETGEITAGATTKKRRRVMRARTSYQLAHPAPTLTRQQKLLQIRPKLLLQLQRLSPDKRPLPSIDVLPSTVVVPRLRKRFPRMLKGKGELGANDVIVVRSEDYDTPDEHSASDTTEDESLESREVLAVICQIQGIPGSVEICLSDGSVWYGTSLPKGVFEFVATDAGTGEKTTARWVQRLVPRRHSSQPAVSPSVSDPPGDHKYLFSILHSNSRRHPVLASITKNVLDIPDTYTNISPSAGRHQSASSIPTSDLSGKPGSKKDDLERTTIVVDDNLRILIQVTGIWVALRKGWSPYFKYDDYSTLGPGRPSSLSLPKCGSSSRVNANGNDKSSNLETRASTPESNQSSFGPTSGKSLRSGSNIFRSSPSGTSPTSPGPSVRLPRRATSTGAVFMQRAAARRVGHPPSTVASDGEGETVSVMPVHVTSAPNIILSTDTSLLPSPPPQALPSLITSSINTTKPFHRRIQSLLTPSHPIEEPEPQGAHGQTNGHGPSTVQGSAKSSMQPENKKAGKWKSLIKFLRHDNDPGR